MKNYVHNALTSEMSYFMQSQFGKDPEEIRGHIEKLLADNVKTRFVFVSLGADSSQCFDGSATTGLKKVFEGGGWTFAGKRPNAWWRKSAGDLHIYVRDLGPGQAGAEKTDKKAQYRNISPYEGGVYNSGSSTYGTDGSCGIWFVDEKEPAKPNTSDASLYETEMLTLWQLPAKISSERRALLKKHGWHRVIKTDVAQFWSNGKE